MDVKATYTPTIMDGAVVRWKLDDSAQISASRNGIGIHGVWPIISGAASLEQFSELIDLAWATYNEMKNAIGDGAHDHAKKVVEEFNSQLS